MGFVPAIGLGQKENNSLRLVFTEKAPGAGRDGLLGQILDTLQVPGGRAALSVCNAVVRLGC